MSERADRASALPDGSGAFPLPAPTVPPAASGRVGRSIRRVAALVVVVLAAAACNGSPTDAARVNGTAISQSDIRDEIDALIKAVQTAPDDKIPPEQRVSLLNQLRASGVSSSPSAQASASLLTNRIFGVLVSDALDRFGLSVEAEDIEASTADVDQASIYGLTASKWRQQAIDSGARTSRLSRYLEDTSNVWYTDADVDTYYAAKKGNYVQACSSHILVEDRETAERILGELRGGGDFAALAAANSTDESNKDKGGDLGCQPKGTFVPPFEAALSAAKDGELVGPVQTDFGYHLIKVTSAYAARPLDDALRSEIKTALGTPVGWLELTVAKAKITVNSKYGTWSPADLAVVPPKGAATPTTAAPSALGAGGGVTGQ